MSPIRDLCRAASSARSGSPRRRTRPCNCGGTLRRRSAGRAGTPSTHRSSVRPALRSIISMCSSTHTRHRQRRLARLPGAPHASALGPADRRSLPRPLRLLVPSQLLGWPDRAQHDRLSIQSVSRSDSSDPRQLKSHSPCRSFRPRASFGLDLAQTCSRVQPS